MSGLDDQPQLGLTFDDADTTSPTNGPDQVPKRPAGRVVRVRPDVVGIRRVFDYVVSPRTDVELGDVVRIRLAGRSVRGWVVALDVEPDATMELQTLTKVSGRGPTDELIELADWAAWRWAGRPAHFLRTATPDANVTRLPPPAVTPEARSAADRDVELFEDALASDRGVLRLAPAEDRYPLVRQAVGSVPRGGHALVLVPSVGEALALAGRLSRDGAPAVALAGQDPASAQARAWAAARAGSTVIGTRSAAWAPMPDLSRVLVLDEHDESYQGEQTPTWHARDVVIERAARAGAPCLLVSPTPSLEALTWGDLIVPARNRDRAGWPRLEVVDQRELDPAVGPLFSPNLVGLVRGEGRVLCVLNRTGRVRLLACGACRSIARCEACDAAVALQQGTDGDVLVCDRDGHSRPVICLECGGTDLKNLRLGVNRAAEELAVLAGEPVGEVTASSADVPSNRVLIGTEALLHRVSRADAVIFMDIDQHLLAPRFRAGEQTLALLGRAARIVSRARGRLVVQTRSPDHPVLVAVGHADPSRWAEGELPLRRAVGLPPFTALALVSGAGAPEFMRLFGRPEGVLVQGPVDERWRLRSDTHVPLCDALAAPARPEGRLRLDVDPPNA